MLRYTYITCVVQLCDIVYRQVSQDSNSYRVATEPTVPQTYISNK